MFNYNGLKDNVKLKRIIFIILIVIAIIIALAVHITWKVFFKDNTDILGMYKYPQEPAISLRDFLYNYMNKHNIPIEIGAVEAVNSEGTYRLGFTINFTDGNACVILFEGDNSPSFIAAFKNPDDSEDMVTILTYIIMYIDPKINMQDAKALATKQDDDISIDGYSIPQDIGGYQIQSYYTNPHTFYTIEGFKSKMGIKISALNQIWGKEINISQYYKLSSIEDYNMLTEQYISPEYENIYKGVYANFIVKDWWKEEDVIHGNTTTWVEVETYNKRGYRLRLDTSMIKYEFGVGEEYTIFISSNYYTNNIIYAIQVVE